MASKLEQLKSMTTVVADSGDLEEIRAFGVTDSTTNPTLILKASQIDRYAYLVDEAIAWGQKTRAQPGAVTDRLAVNFGEALTKIVPGRVSTEVDADLSFDTDASVAKAHRLIDDYASRGVGRERILIKLASTWEGIQAAKILQREGIDCNLTLMFSMAQAAAAADVGAFLISPFVGRIMDWYAHAEGKTYGPEEDPGVKFVRGVYSYYKANGIKTVIMGASFRNLGEIEALAGCDRLTISPKYLQELAKDEGELTRRLDPAKTSGAPKAVTHHEGGFRFALNEDAMATEKLADGIRLFAEDLRALRATVAMRLQKAA